ncbi:MAG: glycosyltransferase, partial [Bdellovibrionota bacterium]
LIDIGKLGSLENVTIHGPFNGNEEIPFHRFDLFLYTSVWDGLPNILLEASAHGLPILAPDVGGVRELIDANTGFLVSKSHAVREYLDGIELVRRNPRLAQSRAKAAQKILRRRHSWKEFQKNYRQILKTIGFAP